VLIEYGFASTMPTVTTAQAGLWLWLEAGMTAVIYATAGASMDASPRALLRLAIAMAVHAVVGAGAWFAAGGPGDPAALAAVRSLVGAEALVAWGAAALAVKARL
jgi:hypothetical protein